MTNKILLVAANLLFLLPSGLCVAQSAEQQSNSRFVLTLNDSNVASLKSLGMIQSRELGQDAIGKIGAVQLQFNGAATDQAVIADAAVVVSGNACQVTLNDAIIELARKQPIRINVPANSVFSRVFFKFEGEVSTSDQPSAPILNSEGSARLSLNASNDAKSFFRHFVKLSENKTLEGQMDLAESIKFDTKFGEVDISIGQIRGIRFHIDGEDSAMIVLKNGDTITGVPQSDTFTMTTDWGKADFEAVYIESITTSPNASFNQSNDPGFGPRWQLLGN